jgi:serine/threonine protein kinase
MVDQGDAGFEAHYILGELLGSGGMGTVHSAVQRAQGTRVALKRPHPEFAADPHVSRRFRAEALAGGRLDHGNIARVIDFGGRDGALFLVMEYVPGIGLDELVILEGPMEPRLAIEVCCQILAALEVAHTAGIIHADIKSGNIVVEPRTTAGPRVRLIDFGLARFCSEPELEGDRLLSGTPCYLAPELIRSGLPTVASDLYAAGVILYELLTGSTPFRGGSSEDILQRQLADAVVPPSLRSPEQDIPSALDDVVVRALAKDPAARFATAASFADALRSARPARLPRSRTARGTPSAPFSRETTTRDWPPEERVTTASVESDRVREIRLTVGTAITNASGDAIVSSYLELVRALVDEHHLASAVAELDSALILLRPVNAAATPAAMWRLQLCLAALYSGLGDPTRARNAARVGREDAMRADSSVGVERADELLVRLTRYRRVVHGE